MSIANHTFDFIWQARNPSIAVRTLDWSRADVVCSPTRRPNTNWWSPVGIKTRTKQRNRSKENQTDNCKFGRKDWARVQLLVISQTNDFAATVTTALATAICPVTNPDNNFASCLLTMNLHLPLPKIRTIGDELTLSLAKTSHFSFLPSHFPSLPSRRGHHGGAEIRNEFTLSIAKNFFALRLCSPSFKWHEPRDEWSKTQDKWSNPAQSYFSSHRKNESN